MAIQSIQVYVLGASEDEFYLIEHLLAHCGVYRYTVCAIQNEKAAMRSMQRNEADCYIVGSIALSEWFGHEAEKLAASLPVVALGKTQSPHVASVDPDEMSLGQLLIAMRTSMRIPRDYEVAAPASSLTMVLAS